MRVEENIPVAEMIKGTIIGEIKTAVLSLKWYMTLAQTVAGTMRHRDYGCNLKLTMNF